MRGGTEALDVAALEVESLVAALDVTADDPELGGALEETVLAKAALEEEPLAGALLEDRGSGSPGASSAGDSSAAERREAGMAGRLERRRSARRRLQATPAVVSAVSASATPSHT